MEVKLPQYSVLSFVGFLFFVGLFFVKVHVKLFSDFSVCVHLFIV